MPYIRLPQHRLFYTRHGSHSHRPALLLIHGAGGSHLDWPAALRRMPDTAVYALDLPGHGRSDPPGHDTITAYAESVAAFIRQMELTHIIVVGHSMGGAIAQEIGLMQPPWLAGLVLVGTSARLRVSPLLLESTLSDTARAAAFIAQYAWSAQADAALREQGQRQLAALSPAILHGDYQACNAYDRVGELGRIQVPTLVISGSADQMTPAKYGRSLAAEIPQAHYVEIENVGHYIMLEAETAVAEAIQSFLNTR